MPRKMIEEGSSLETKNKYLPFGIGLVFIALIFLAFFWFDVKKNKKEALQIPANSTVPSLTSAPGFNQQVAITNSSDPAMTELANKVSRHIILPNGDVTVLIVSDPELLSKQISALSFLNKGDVILNYADRAIVYDPTLDLIKDVLHFSPSEASPKDVKK